MRSEDEGHAEAPERTRFYHLDHSWSFDGEDHVISVAAYQLHIKSTADATVRDHPGFVPDEYLNSLGTDTTIPVLELVTSGYWERADGGYRIRDWDLIRVSMEHAEMLRHRAAFTEQARTCAEQEEVLRRYQTGDPHQRPDEPPADPEAASPG